MLPARTRPVEIRRRRRRDYKTSLLSRFGCGRGGGTGAGAGGGAGATDRAGDVAEGIAVGTIGPRTAETLCVDPRGADDAADSGAASSMLSCLATGNAAGVGSRDGPAATVAPVLGGVSVKLRAWAEGRASHTPKATVESTPSDVATTMGTRRFL